jgi:hypothetical protein
LCNKTNRRHRVHTILSLHDGQIDEAASPQMGEQRHTSIGGVGAFYLEWFQALSRNRGSPRTSSEE